MKPGKELDALIAKNVMGDKIWICSWYSEWIDDWQMPNIKYFSSKADAEKHLSEVRKAKIPSWAKHEVYKLGDIMHYSTDISAAWKVFEKLRDLGCGPSLHIGIDKLGPYTTISYFRQERPWVLVESEKFRSCPHAICLAALKAVEGK